MEFNFSPFRLLLLALLLGTFASLDGFKAPEVPRDNDALHSPARVHKAWSYCVLLFVVGAGSASIVDHTVGNLDRTNIRSAYILLGLLLMGGAYFWLKTLRQSVERPSKIASRTVLTSPPP